MRIDEKIQAAIMLFLLAIGVLTVASVIFGERVVEPFSESARGESARAQVACFLGTLTRNSYLRNMICSQGLYYMLEIRKYSNMYHAFSALLIDLRGLVFEAVVVFIITKVISPFFSPFKVLFFTFITLFKGNALEAFIIFAFFTPEPQFNQIGYTTQRSIRDCE